MSNSTNINNWSVIEYNLWTQNGSLLNETVETLDLTGQTINNLSEYIANLVNLKYLYLNYTGITRLPDGIGNLHKLVELYLKGNNITTLPNTIGNLKNLEILDLDFNSNLIDLPSSTASIIVSKSGFSARELTQNNLFTLLELVEAGYPLPRLKNEDNYSVAELRDAYITAPNIIAAGFTLEDLRDALFSLGDFIAAGFTLAELIAAGFTARQLTENYLFDLRDIVIEGYPLQRLKNEDYYTVAELKNAGIILYQLKTVYPLSFLINGYFSARELTQDNLFDLLDIVNAGYPLPRLKNEDNYVVEDLRQANITAPNIIAAGFTLEDLRLGGFTVNQLRQDGYTAEQLFNVGKFTLNQLIAAGFTARQLTENNLFSLIDIVESGYYTLENLRFQDNYSVAELRAANIPPMVIKEARFTFAEFIAAGFTLQELIEAGVTLTELRETGTHPWELKEAGFTLGQLKAAGFTLQELKSVYPLYHLTNAGFTLAEFIAAWFTARQLTEDNLFYLRDIVNAGYPLPRLKNEDYYTASELRASAIDASQVRGAGFSLPELIAAGFTLAELIAAGFTARQLTENYLFDLSDIVNAGYPLPRLKNEDGYTVFELKAGRLNAFQIIAAGFTLEHLIAALFTARELTHFNLFNLRDIVIAGYYLPRLKNQDNYSFAELKDAGFSLPELKDAGFSLPELKAAGFTLPELKDAEFTLPELKAAGFSLPELKAGFSLPELLEAGFTLEELTDEGVSIFELKSGGFTPDELKEAGFNVSQLRVCGFSASELKSTGSTATDLISAGFSLSQLIESSFSASELKDAGFTASDLISGGVQRENKPLQIRINSTGISADPPENLLSWSNNIVFIPQLE